MAKIDIDALAIGIHRIEPSLYIRKRPAPRAPVWVYVYSLNGRRKEASLGLCNKVSMTAAKQKLAKMKVQVDQGIDPVEARRQARSECLKPARFTFAQLVDEALPVIAKAKRWRNPKSAAQWKSSIQTYAVPVLGTREVESITRDDILSVLQPIWDTKAETASRLRGRLEAVFAYAIVTKRYSQMNPCLWRGGLDLFLASTERIKVIKHQESLTIKQTQDLLVDIDFSRLSVSWMAICFGILTATRVNEFVCAKWSEIDLKARVWSCPRRKDGKQYPHRVPLSIQAMLLLRTLERTSEYLFPSPTDPKRHISKETPRVLIKKRMGYGTMHGFRSTFCDWCAETGKDRVLAEKSLMHATGNEVEQAYQRSDLLEQRRPLMQAWADTILPMETLKEVLPESMNTPTEKY